MCITRELWNGNLCIILYNIIFFSTTWWWMKIINITQKLLVSFARRNTTVGAYVNVKQCLWLVLWPRCCSQQPAYHVQRWTVPTSYTKSHWSLILDSRSSRAKLLSHRLVRRSCTILQYNMYNHARVYNTTCTIMLVCAVVKVVLWSRGGGSPDEARLEQTPYPFQPH